MPRRAAIVALALLAVLATSAGTAGANARLVSVIPLDGGCVSGPEGGPSAVQQWNVQPGSTYRITLAAAVECTNGGTDPTLHVRMNSGSAGNSDVVAALVATGTYEFDFTVPPGARCTMPINYCTIPGQGESGIRVLRDDGIDKQAHLRMASFGPGCTALTTSLGAECLATPTRAISWGRVKAIYR